jgi:hypothetical protein
MEPNMTFEHNKGSANCVKETVQVDTQTMFDEFQIVCETW